MKINFIESCIYNIFSKKNIEFKYFDKDFKEEISICNRTIYKIDDFNKEKLFKEIILSDIGGDMDLVSKVFIFDMDKKEIFHLYDDRGIAIYYLNS